MNLATCDSVTTLQLLFRLRPTSRVLRRSESSMIDHATALRQRTHEAEDRKSVSDPPALASVMGPNMGAHRNTGAVPLLGRDRSSRSSGPVRTPVRHEAA